MSLPNDIFEAALTAHLVTDTAEGVPGPVDFRSLGVREFGTTYEGLLESELGLEGLTPIPASTTSCVQRRTSASLRGGPKRLIPARASILVIRGTPAACGAITP